MSRRLLPALVLLIAGCAPSAPDPDQPLTAEEVAPVAEQYATLVAANYADAHASALELRDAIANFVAAPGEAGLEAARLAWLDARESYGQTEVFRFYDGPIDNPDDGPEGQLNAWPMDEAYVDYVEGMPDAGIINDPAGHPTIDTELLSSLNEQGGETNISSGYHAIEFLLWGQDRSADGPGARPWTDYDSSGAGTAANQDRRGTYLLAAAELLVADLQQLVDAWDGASSSNYRAMLLDEQPEEIVRRMLLGMGSLSGAELAGERIEVALATRDQEDEHSCFSDNTHRDVVSNALGIQNVYLGRYGSSSGASLYELIAARDQALADRLADQIQASVDAAEAIPAPFDRAIVDDREAVEATVEALRTQTDSIVEVAALFAITLALE
ncbi:MAG TPA: imelysin family protein [Enhygromyxa sp.]|nr:imelysin family protein [Enhygromyxa sp.]